MNKIYHALQRFFEESQWAGIEDEENAAIGLNYVGANGQWTCIAQARETQGQLIFYSIAPIGPPPDKYAAVGYFLHRVNFGMIIGNFEFDLDDGEIRYKTSIDAANVELTTALIKPIVIANLAAMDRYLPALEAVLDGITPDKALADY